MSTKPDRSFIKELDMFLDAYKIGDSTDLITFKNLKLLSYDGYQYLVFHHQDIVLKIERRRTGFSMFLREDILKSLMNIKTKRILMPDAPIYNKSGEYVGYAMQYIKNKKDVNNILMDEILEEFYLIASDRDLLSKNFIKLDDITADNAVYNGNIYIVDCGLYSDIKKNHTDLEYYLYEQKDIDDLKEKELFDTVTSINKMEINNFVLEFIMLKTANVFNENDRIQKLRGIEYYIKNVAKKVGTTEYIDAIAYDAPREMTVSEYAKKLLKSLN